MQSILQWASAIDPAVVARITAKKLPKPLYCGGMNEHNECTQREEKKKQRMQLRIKLKNHVFYSFML